MANTASNPGNLCAGNGVDFGAGIYPCVEVVPFTKKYAELINRSFPV